MQLSYSDGTVLVTGGSGGIGSAIVASLAGPGLPVALTYRSRKEAAEAIVRAHAGATRIGAYRLSTSRGDDAADLLRRVASEIGPVRYLVCSAGIAQESAFHTLSEEQWRRLIDVNLAGVVSIARGAVTTLMKSGFGRIVFISSVSGLRGLKGHTVYAATKAALHGFARSLAQECAPFGVTVNCVAPGYIETPMLQSAAPAARAAAV